jgi:2-dehydropantoate 2-reductase
MADPLHRRAPGGGIQGRLIFFHVSWTFQSVAVVGSGAVGLYYGGRLAEAGEDVRFLARSDYESLKDGGLVVESEHGDFKLERVNANRASGEIGPVDLVIVAWKATANVHLATVLPPLLHPGTQVLTLQNGLGNCERLAEIVGPERVIGGLCFVCINRTAPAKILHSAGGRVTLGEYRPDEKGRVAELERRFKAAKIQAVAVADLQKSQWEKLVWNIPFNGLSVAEGGVTTEDLLGTVEGERKLRELMAEVITAARALGLELADDLIDSNIHRTRPMGPYRTSSMIDFLEGREVEVEPIWEEPLRRAASVGVEMPRTREMLARIRQRLAERIA